MIAANELRIGNYIVSRNGEVKKVENVQKNSFNQIMDSDDVSGSYLLSHYSGIPLTPEILEKCGFDKNGYLKLTNNIRLEWSFGNDFWLSNTEGETLFTFENVTSLHQLQNLYFTLTGEELTYTP